MIFLMQVLNFQKPTPTMTEITAIYFGNYTDPISVIFRQNIVARRSKD